MNVNVNAQRFELVRSSMPMSAPRIIRGKVIWPWYLTAQERLAAAARVRAERIDFEQLDRVLEERTLRANQKSEASSQ